MPGEVKKSKIVMQHKKFNIIFIFQALFIVLKSTAVFSGTDSGDYNLYWKNSNTSADEGDELVQVASNTDYFQNRSALLSSKSKWTKSPVRRNRTGFTDYHGDGSITNNPDGSNWTVQSGNSGKFAESGGILGLSGNTGDAVQLVNDYNCADDGSFEVDFSFDWDPQRAGVLFRWSDTSSFYYAYFCGAGEATVDTLRVAEDAVTMTGGTLVTSSANLSSSATYTLKIVLNGNTASFYIDGNYLGSFTDASHASGRVGYASPSGVWNGGMAFDEAVWTDGDSDPPTVSAYSPVDDASAVGVNDNLVLTFNEAVDAESGGNNDIVIKLTSDNSIFETIDAMDAKVTGSGTATITINPSGTFAANTGYYVQIGADAFDDAFGNSYAGISNTTTWNFTTSDHMKWGITSSDFTSYSTATQLRLMGGTSPNLDSMYITKIFYRSYGSGTITVAVYSGDNLADPTSNETRLTHEYNQSVSAGWNEIDVTDVAWPKNTVTWVAMAWSSGAGVYYSSGSSDCGDFQSARGRYDQTNPSDYDESTACPTEIGAGNFDNYWYAVHIGYVINDNVAPTDISLSNSSVNENQASGTVVGTFTTTDANSGDSHTYTLVSGTGDSDNSKFQIDGSLLKTNVPASDLLYEDDHTFSIRVRSTDDGFINYSYEKVFTITLNNTIMGNGSNIDLNFSGGWKLGGRDADAEQLSASRYFDGCLDEIRVVAAQRSADWIKLCYETQKVDQNCITFVIGDEIELLPLTVVHDIGTDETDSCMIYTDNWTIVFKESAGGGITWLSDSANHGGPNQMTDNLFYITAGGSDGYSGSGTLTMLENNTIFCRLRQRKTIASHDWTIEYTVYGAGRMYIHVETEAHATAYDPTGGIEFRVAGNCVNSAYYYENATASQSNYVLHSDTGSNRYDILLAPFKDWSQASGFTGVSGTDNYFGYKDDDWQLAAFNKQCWDFLVDFGHMKWDDAAGVGPHVDDYRNPDSLEFLQGWYRMERSWQDGLIAHWHLDEAVTGSADGETVYDLSGASTSHDGTVTGGNFTDGKWNGGLIFDGDDYITITSGTADFNTPVFTLMMWIKPTVAITASSVLFSKWASDKGLKLAGDASNNLAVTLDGKTISGGGPGTDAAHIAVTCHYHSGRLKLFIDGEPVYYQVHQYPLTPNSENVILGNGFSGVIDDVRFYNTELSEETIKAVYMNGYRPNEGQYMLRASNNNTVHFKISGSVTYPRYFPIFQIDNYWHTSKPDYVYYNGAWMTENTHYLAALDDAANILYIGFNSNITSTDLRIYIDDADEDGAYMVNPTDTLTRGAVSRGGYYVKNTGSSSFGPSGSNEFYLYWKMDNGETGHGGELYEFKSSDNPSSENTAISSASNLIQTNDNLYGTFGYHDHYYNGSYGNSADEVTATPDYTVLEASGARVRLQIDKRSIDDVGAGNVQYDLTTIWTIYPTGQIFRYDTVKNMNADFSDLFFRFRLAYEGNCNYDSSNVDLRGVLYNTTASHDYVVALLSTADKNGLKDLFTGTGSQDTMGFQYSSTYNYMGFKFDGSDGWAAANAPYLIATYLDIRDQNMSSAYMDSVGESVQDIDFDDGDMKTGSRVTTTEGDLDADGFNEAEGAYIVQASSNSVDFTLQADAGTDGCRFYPAIRVNNYYANTKPKYVYLHNGSTEKKLLDGYGYNCYHNKTDDYLVIQLDTVLCADVDIYISADNDLAVTLSDFYAKSGDGNDTLFWRTESEKDNLGFNIYRRIEPVFMDSLVRALDSVPTGTELNTAGRMLKKNEIGYIDTNWALINPTLIPGADGGTSAGPRDYKKIDWEVDNHILYEYKLEAISFDKTREMYGPVRVKPVPIFPKKFFLFHNFPNPIIRYTNIRFDIPKKTTVSLYIYNLQGRLIRRLIKPDKKMKPGFYRVLWNCTDDWGRKVAAGPYIYRLKAGKKYAKSRLMIVVK